MHGVRVRAENPNGPRTTYFSYQRTRRQGRTLAPALATAVPLFPLRLMTDAHVDISSIPSGLALQNISPRKAAVQLELLSPTGQVLKATSTAIGVNRYMLRELSEWFDIAYGTPAIVRVRSNIPIQVLGVRVDGAGEALAFPPR